MVEKVTLVAHYGMTQYKNYGRLDYQDYKVGVNYDVGGWILGVSYFGVTDMSALAKANFYTSTGLYAQAPEKKLYRSGAVFSLTKTF